MKIEDYEVLIFDCDGVILDTNKLKVSAFKKVLNEFGISHVQKFLNYFKRNFGRSRYIHVKYFIEDILKRTFDEELYNRILIIMVISANYSTKALKFVRALFYY